MSNSPSAQDFKPVRPVDRYIDISGPDRYGHGKAHIDLVYCIRYDDEEGTTVVRRELNIPPKPIVMISQHAGYANVLLDFISNNDADLRLAWIFCRNIAARKTVFPGLKRNARIMCIWTKTAKNSLFTSLALIWSSAP